MSQSSSDRLDVLQRSRIDLYLNCTSKKDRKSATTRHQIIQHCPSKILCSRRKYFYLKVNLSQTFQMRYTKLTEDDSSSNSVDVLQRSRIELYLNCNSKEEQRSTR
ncbi:hypothetical protein V1477_001451 [Vespula maculifrons]|uniref:Uncharacterized protein n=1 Tax=Vespula maculifrons TaxID=7453 RepID=A0ABD2CYX5_VESMC